MRKSVLIRGFCRVEGLSKDFGALRAVNQVTLEVESGVHSIIGPNGAGKTTLFNLLTGFLKPDEGRIFYQGRDITHLEPFAISQLGMARSFQITSIFPELTVHENIRLALAHLPLNLQSQMVFYYFLLRSVILSALILIRVVNSPFGKTLQAQRENRNRAMSIGYDVDRFKLTAFIISAFFSGLAGGFYALLLNFVPLSSLHWTNSGEVVVMTITGGLGTLFGPVLGAVGVILLRDIISNYTESWTFIMGILFMAAVLGFRSGLIGILRTKLRLTIY